jgi:hypothetical protein
MPLAEHERFTSRCGTPAVYDLTPTTAYLAKRREQRESLPGELIGPQKRKVEC